MEYPPAVDVDISMPHLSHHASTPLTSLVLDPFILNILPRSLAPTAVYITFVALVAWILSGYIYRWLLSVTIDPSHKPHTN